MTLWWLISRVTDGRIGKQKKIFLQFNEHVGRVIRQITRNYDLLFKDINYSLLPGKYNLPLPDT